jgi:iron(II)-dependent oxidoreductase
MGISETGGAFLDAKPVHKVAIKAFEMSKTHVTVEQYAECVSKGACSAPYPGSYCNWGVEGRRHHPVNCVDIWQAEDDAIFKGARLPREAEWEYAARSGGKDMKYPWGGGAPTCDKAVINDSSPQGIPGCGEGSTWPVCSKPAGNTAQGLCDMAGNLGQWVQYTYADSYKAAPADGSAFVESGDWRPHVVRGGSFDSFDSDKFRTGRRSSLKNFPGDFVGFRIARSR